VEPLTIKLFKEDNSVLPSRATAKSFGYDLVVNEAVTIEPKSMAFVGTGLKLIDDLPLAPGQGVSMLLLPRSSLLARHGLIIGNSPGLIDADYTGEIKLVLWNPSDNPVEVKEGSRLAQALFVHTYLPEIKESELIVARDERGGLGSTGE
jgi:dUTP pyrophosphatase